MTWDRATIRTRVRNYTGQTETSDIDNTTLDLWINEFYREKMPEEIDLQILRTFYTFSLTAGTDIYTKNSDIAVLREPAYIDEGKIKVHKDPAAFWEKYTQRPPWQASRSYVVGDVVVASTGNGYLYRCTVAGTSSSSEPTWPTTLSGTVSDGSVTWEYYKDDRAEPTDVLDYAGNLYFRPTPKYEHYFKAPATQKPTALSDTNTDIVDQRLGLLISLGASILILLENDDKEAAMTIEGAYEYEIKKISGREMRHKFASRGKPRF